MIPTLIVLCVIVFLIIAAVVVFVVLDFKGEKLAASRASRAAKKSAKNGKKKPKGKSMPAKPAPAKAVAEEVAQPASVSADRQEMEEAVERIYAQAVNLPNPEPEHEQDGEDDENITAVKAVTENGKTRYIVIKYSKSFLAKLIQSQDEVKEYYSEIKNNLLSYKGVKSRLSWRWETFRSGRTVLARLRLRGKSLSLALPLDAASFAESKYHVEDFSDVKSFVDTPCMYRIKNDRRLKYSADLIALVMEKNSIAVNEKAEKADYVIQLPYATTEALLARKLIKELTDEEAQSGTVFKTRKSVTVAEADTLIEDEIAVQLVQKAAPVAQKSGAAVKPSDRTKVDIVNIDTLSQYFNDGEEVTLEEIKKRVPEVSKRTTYIKVLARGTLDKSLTVYADSFSLQAVKMIVLTGGKAVKN